MRRSRLAALPLSQRRHPKLEHGGGNSRRHRPDYWLLILMSALLITGAMVVYAIGPGLTIGTDLTENYYSSKQITAIVLGLLGFLVAANMPLGKWKKYQIYVIGGAIISAIMVRFVGEEINGAHRWIQLGGFSFQTAELVKLALVLWLANFLAQRRLQGKMEASGTFKYLGVTLLSIVSVVVSLQSDLGSAAVMVAIVGATAYVAGLPLRRLGIVTITLFIIASLAIVASPYRRDRVSTFLNPTADCQDEGYQACQALITIGSGGFLGKGLGKSVQAYGYLPEPANDSIFAIVAEKFGFVGAVSVVAIFLALFRRITTIAKSASTEYARLLVTGILVWLSIQTFINIGAMVGLLPLKGITLPFVSYGGTSIIFVMIAMGIVFQVSRYTDLSIANNNSSRRERVGYRRARS